VYNLAQKVREAKGSDLTVEDMNMIADINRIVLNLAFMSRLLMAHSPTRIQQEGDSLD
jgi:hypothetical protein